VPISSVHFQENNKIIVTRFHIIQLQCTKFYFGCSSPDPAGGAYSAPQTPLTGFYGATSKGRKGGKDGKRKKKGKRLKRKAQKARFLIHIFGYATGGILVQALKRCKPVKQNNAECAVTNSAEALAHQGQLVTQRQLVLSA